MHEIEDLRLPLGIEAVGRLVEKDNVRIVHDRLCQLHALAHPGRVGVDLAITLLAHAHKIEHLVGPLPRGLKGKAAKFGAIGDVLAADHAGNVAILFGGVADPHANLPPFRAHLASKQPSRTAGNRL